MTEKQYESDIEDTDDYLTHRRPTSPDSDTGAQSDFASNKQDLASDIVSVDSRASSVSRSNRRSIRSAGTESRVERRRRGSGSGSDSDGGYISLDDYIVGGSDCVSFCVLSEDGGEGSDAVGSDVEVRSDVGEGSDVASFSDDGDYEYEDDCIENDSDDYYGSHVHH